MSRRQPNYRVLLAACVSCRRRGAAGGLEWSGARLLCQHRRWFSSPPPPPPPPPPTPPPPPQTFAPSRNGCREDPVQFSWPASDEGWEQQVEALQEDIAAAEEEEEEAAHTVDPTQPQLSTGPYIKAMTSSDVPLHYHCRPTARASADSRPPGEEEAASDYLLRADELYLAYPARVRLPPWGSSSSGSAGARRCLLVVYGHNDLRTRDHYALALAAKKAVRYRHWHPPPMPTPSTSTSSTPLLGLPLVAAVVLDYRVFAQPSRVAGFFRQGPMRAQLLLETVASLRHTLETVYGIPLLVRCGRPEEHIPRLAVELGAAELFMTTQYSPHERQVQERIEADIRAGTWVSRREVVLEAEAEAVEVEVRRHGPAAHPYYVAPAQSAAALAARQQLVPAPSCATREVAAGGGAPLLHLVWQSTLLHLHDMPRPLASMRESERWYHDDITCAVIRPTAPYTAAVEAMQVADIHNGESGARHAVNGAGVPLWAALLPDAAERRGLAPPPPCRGRLPTLEELGYFAAGCSECGAVKGTWGRGDRRWFIAEDIIATQSAHGHFPLLDAGKEEDLQAQGRVRLAGARKGAEASLGASSMEEMARERAQTWLETGGLTSLLRFGRGRRTNTKLYSQRLGRLSPYISLGVLSPRQVYEALRLHAAAHADGFSQQQCREGILRLSQRDFCHWAGLRYGASLFHPYGPRPEDTGHIPDSSRGGWRLDPKVIHKWCRGLTGFPFADAAAKELLTTGFVAAPGRQALAWLLTRGLGQDWRVAAEWLERCSLDFDPFICYYQTLRCCDLLPDDFGDPVRTLHYLAHHHDQTGIYVKKWLPVLSKVPPVYIHRPHVMTERMQAMHGVYLGRNYPYPIKLWDGAVEDLQLFKPGSLERHKLGTYFAEEKAAAARPVVKAREQRVAAEEEHHHEQEQREGEGESVGIGFGEALRHGTAVLPPSEWSAAPDGAEAIGALTRRAWLQELQSRRRRTPQDEEIMAALVEGEESGPELLPAALPAAPAAMRRQSNLRAFEYEA